MAIMAPKPAGVIGGIDTHKDLHTAAVIDAQGAGRGSVFDRG